MASPSGLFAVQEFTLGYIPTQNVGIASISLGFVPLLPILLPFVSGCGSSGGLAPGRGCGGSGGFSIPRTPGAAPQSLPADAFAVAAGGSAGGGSSTRPIFGPFAVLPPIAEADKEEEEASLKSGMGGTKGGKVGKTRRKAKAKGLFKPHEKFHGGGGRGSRGGGGGRGSHGGGGGITT